MQVHLKETDAEKTDHEDSKVDKSESVTERVSLVINTTATRPLLEFGLAILQNTGFIPKGSEVVTTESACQWQSEQPVVIAGIRLHTHSRGVWMEALLEHKGRWQVVGEGDPSLPEDVLPVNGTRVVQRGDFLAARCYFRQDPARDIPFGSSWTEEMCNLHVLYLLPIGAAPSIRFQLCTNQVPSIALRHLFPNLPSLRTDISPEPEDREVGM
ncbi:peptidyl-glycine alpha-amidating monooxygenase-like [Pomacea canaliculata]|uniref:peptidyl-glycine alpha-amidating monooxygenase-like n=1 Tax=Pomacea canaliculata TaxID=400727 RepID=UPI000D730E5F|nr:peptidyl-glycine alpha-amidating monooxygenase-like [Pomacea canaliculata]XP_025093106.1 peptidyl-glycine alpha-amidating monooxygenase-like [Pomacea canaliculata]XP_025093107.1 peptidyl-glycine alpha-amidating monooxygenase-like [Pomacea canaliculata]XP_025093108.1 peptidyl-glycine alpha-amidating monooxygenase-like [Pomacea canaliculata]